MYVLMCASCPVVCRSSSAAVCGEDVESIIYLSCDIDVELPIEDDK